MFKIHEIESDNDDEQNCFVNNYDILYERAWCESCTEVCVFERECEKEICNLNAVGLVDSLVRYMGLCECM